jgi:opacity protein-like surface antigen
MHSRLDVFVKQSVRRCAAVAALTAASVAQASAQPAGDEWDVFVAPYLMGAAMSGTTTVRGVDVDVDLTASDVFSNLQFGGMGVAVARRGDWGFGTDLIWMALGTTVRDANVDFNQGAFAFYGLRRLSAAADVTFGLRINTLQGELTFKGSGVTRHQNQTWVDPIAGVTVRTTAKRLVQLRLYAEVGGFGAGSDLTWQVFPGLSVNLTQKLSLDLGYRWLDLDYATGEGNDQFRYDVLTQGPVIGFGFRF